MTLLKTITGSFCSLFLLLLPAMGFAQLDPLKHNGAETSASTPEVVTAPPLSAEELAIKADPKQAFKNLFETTFNKSNTIRGIKTEHLNPQAVSFVQDYMKVHEKNLNSMKSWAKPYFDMMDDVLERNGIPKQLKYLAVIESNLRASAISWAGAVGPWQFMPGTARNMGLAVNDYIDERRDYLKSTQAATRYLNQLYGLYKDWLLVVAAYNCGPGCVNSAINRTGSANFWSLQYQLPTETRNHVKKFIATHYIMEGQGGVTTLPKDEAAAMKPKAPDPVADRDVKLQTINGRFLAKAVAKYLEMDLKEFNKLNPGMEKTLASNTSYQLRLPMDKVDLFLTRKNEMLNESIIMILNGDYRN